MGGKKKEAVANDKEQEISKPAAKGAAAEIVELENNIRSSVRFSSCASSHVARRR